MTRFRKKPVMIEAEQWFPGRPVDGVFEPGSTNTFYPYIATLEGAMHVSPGDWIITGVKGEKYACKPDIFAATYEEASGASAAEPPPEANPEAPSALLARAEQAERERDEARRSSGAWEQRFYERTGERDAAQDRIAVLESAIREALDHGSGTTDRLMDYMEDILRAALPSKSEEQK